jgi:hypothetical protein
MRIVDERLREGLLFALNRKKPQNEALKSKTAAR